MKALSLTAVLAITLFAAASGASAQQIVVDHFTNTTVFTLNTSGNTPGPISQTDPYNAGTNPLAIGAGSIRTESLTLASHDTGNLALGSHATHNPTANTDLDFSNDVNCAGNLTLAYTFGAKNFTAGGQNNLQILFGASDLVGETAIMTVTDGTHTSTLTQTSAGTGSFTDNFLYSNFVGSANFAALTGLTVQFNSVVAGDYEIDAIQTVPEPATMSLLGLGLVGLIARRKKA
jgi:hypothetical protein